MRTSTADAPAAARTTKSPPDRHHVEQDDVLERECVGGLEREERAEEQHRREPERCDQSNRRRQQHTRHRQGKPRRHLRRARDRTRALDRVSAVVRGVADVVHEVVRTRRGAVRPRTLQAHRSIARHHPSSPRRRCRRRAGGSSSTDAGGARRLRPAPAPAAQGVGRRRCARARTSARSYAATANRRAACAGRTSRKRLPGRGSNRARSCRRARQPARVRSRGRVPCPSRLGTRTGGRCGRGLPAPRPGRRPAPRRKRVRSSATSSSSTRPPVGGPAEGVRQEVGDDLQDAVAVRHDRGLRLEALFVVDAAAACFLAEQRIRLVAEPLHVDLFLQQGEAPRLELRKIENVVHEAFETRALARDQLERSRPHLRILGHSIPERGDVTADRRQRRTQLVRHAHEEVPFLLLGLGEPRRHLAETVGQVPDLIAATDMRDVHVVAAPGDLVGRA